MFSQICQLTKNNNERLNWDEYFMSIALLASQRSPCQRLHVGSVVVKDNRLISMGYNGFIAGTPHASLIREGHERAIIYSEINALANSNRLDRTCPDGATIYITHYPCINCFKSIAVTGIKEIVYMYDYNNDVLVKIIAQESNIKIRKIVIC